MRWTAPRKQEVAHLIRHGSAVPSPPLPGEVARRSRDGEVAANLRQPLSQPSAASSPARGAFGPLRRGHPSGHSGQLLLTRGALEPANS